MQESSPLKRLLSTLWPLHRTLVADDTDKALEIIGRQMPADACYQIENYPPGDQAWTWRVPERYVVHDAYLAGADGRRIVDFHDNPLHLVSYSLPIDRWLDWEELEPHLHYSLERPGAIPWVFSYYERSWGFCLSKQVFDGLPRDQRYRAVIRSEFVSDPAQGLRVGTGVISPAGQPQELDPGLLIAAHVCHPFQANDDLSGVVSAVEVARRLAADPLPEGSMAVHFLFCPETIGSICFLSRHEELIPRLRGGIFCEMTGNDHTLALQHSLQGDHLIDRVARHVLQQRTAGFREASFIDLVRNDELVINGPGVNVPCISISRWPYPEYHTSDDSPDIIHEAMLVEAADVVEQIVRIFASSYIPVRTFRGPIFLSGYGLWQSPDVDPQVHAVSEKIMLYLEGQHSIFDIASRLNLSYWNLRDYVERLREKGLIEALPVS